MQQIFNLILKKTSLVRRTNRQGEVHKHYTWLQPEIGWHTHRRPSLTVPPCDKLSEYDDTDRTEGLIMQAIDEQVQLCEYPEIETRSSELDKK